MLWGGWSCAQCGAELNARRQLIGERLDTADGIVIALRSPRQQASRVMMFCGGIGVAIVGSVTLMLSALLGEAVLIGGSAVMLVMMVLGMVGLTRELRKTEAVLTRDAVRWPGGVIRPIDITAVRQDDAAVVVEAGKRRAVLLPLGGPAPLLSAIEEVRQVARDAGTVADVPAALRDVRQQTERA